MDTDGWWFKQDETFAKKKTLNVKRNKFNSAFSQKLSFLSTYVHEIVFWIVKNILWKPNMVLLKPSLFSEQSLNQQKPSHCSTSSFFVSFSQNTSCIWLKKCAKQFVSLKLFHSNCFWTCESDDSHVVTIQVLFLGGNSEYVCYRWRGIHMYLNLTSILYLKRGFCFYGALRTISPFLQ